MPPVRTVAAAALACAFLTQGAAAQAPRPAAPAGGMSEAQVEAIVRKWVEDHPDVVIESLNRYVNRENARKSEERNAAAVAASSEIFDVAGVPMVGNPSGKVTLVYFLDAACGYCKAMTGALDEAVARNPDLRVVHRWVGFLGPASEYASRAVTLAWKRYPDRYAALHHDLMTFRGQVTNEVIDKALAKALGEQPALQVRADLASGAERKALDEAFAANMGLAKRATVEGTPTLFVSNLGVEGVLRGQQRPDALQAAVDKARAAAGK